MTAPPRTAERILLSLGAEPDFRDGVIGDLAEEFVERAGRDGVSAARRWYYREAIRATPHLLRSWMRSAHRQELARIGGGVVTAYTILLITVGVTLAMTRSVAAGLGFSLRTSILPPSDATLSPLVFACLLLLGAAVWMFAGYLAAWLDARTPFISAMALAAAGLGVAIVVGVAAHRGGPVLGVPVLLRFAASIVQVFGGTIAGAIVRVRSAHRGTAAIE
jgi:hypothetical protein